VTVVTDRRSLREALAAQHGRRGLVMTMGALHEGHLSLVREARRHADHVVVTIFVNPAQFAPGEDYERYPRDLAADVAALSTVGADIVYAPSPAEVYPAPTQVSLDPGPISRVLEGATRPIHFAGVALVVTKMLNLIRPEVAVFGQKDAQQLAIIRRLVADLDMGVEIVGAPISREADGLARSSRNAYLLGEDRIHALALSRALRAGIAAAHEGAANDVVAATRAVLEAEERVEVDYVALVDPATFEPVTRIPPAGGALDRSAEPALLLVAATVGSTRLIDNMPVR
jgi:pantoate--beta-alanine ligase